MPAVKTRVVGSYLSPYVRKVLVCLDLKGVAYEIDPIYGNDEFARLSPVRRIPVLIDDAVTLADSSVICEYLDDRYPEPAWFPQGAALRARARWLEEFAEKSPGAVGLPFFCNVRANLITPEIVKTLKQAGCASVGMGIEAGNDELRNRILKRNMSKEQIITACQTIREAGIHLISTNMLGLPGGSLAADFETLDLNVECRPSYANTFLFQPYPGTELGEYARAFGYSGETFDDIDESAWERSVLKFASEEEKRRIETLQKLFALTVEVPSLRPLTKQLIKLPNNRLYWLAHKLWKGYVIKKRIHPHHLSPREYVQVIAHYMKLD